ncbi:hypothetical protein A2819_01250 [Candidatus Azambacteria bacterium RIFCSPHIGHO2_01_FULL_40_24]|uniref:Pyruvate ferredoxin oxidoreductase n=1 Tax=Candidatus Azambacteria bacterium RIFCSPHIGHO2_01_FULL_40_24 TaxID=1797301 RepID=A0A1F5B296_9BACT|nr:MAG: hypothetical protein A2819_01250 [Candidatus Azambacteria bacterium RIFCSPHIGHO2_01_FULL_40_24]
MNNKLACGKTILTGNKAAAYGFALAELDVFGGYPITPSTEITEEMALLASREIISTTYRNTDSELASMALGIGVATAGGRYGTATSSQGLALMFELLHWATTAQLPLVIVNTNRSLGAPWSIHPDQTDSLLFRDLFMPQIYCTSAQETLDMVLWAYRLSEDPQVNLPVLVCLDGFMLSHTAETVVIPAQELVRKFLPEKRFRKDLILPEFGDKKIINLQCPYNWEEHSRRKRALVSAMQSAYNAIPEIAGDWFNIFGKDYDNGFLKISGDPNAKVVVISMGAIIGTIEEALAEKPVKVIGLRFFRPFPEKELRNAIGNASKIIVIDRSILPNGHGVIADELRLAGGACGYNGADIHSFVGGFGGQNFSEENFLNMLSAVLSEIGPLKKTYWMGDAP